MSAPAGTHFYFGMINPCGKCGGRDGGGCAPGKCMDPENTCACGDVHLGEAHDGDLICETCNASAKDNNHPDPASGSWSTAKPCTHSCHLWSGK